MSCSVVSDKPKEILKQQPSVCWSQFSNYEHASNTIWKNKVQLLSLRDKASSRNELTAHEYLPGCVKHYFIKCLRAPWPGFLIIIPRARIGYWLRSHEGERNNYFSKIQLVGQKYMKTKRISQVKARLQACFTAKTLQIWRRFSLLVGYRIQPTSSSTNHNTAFMIDH